MGELTRAVDKGLVNKVIDLLEEEGSNVNETNIVKDDDRLYSALMIAVAQRHLLIAEILIACGADKKYTNAKGDTAMSLAIFARNQPMIDLLNTSVESKEDKATILAAYRKKLQPEPAPDHKRCLVM